jgi:hypothetical protein
MIAKYGSVAFALALFAGAVSAQPDPKPVDDTKLITKVYNLKPLLGERGKASGLADMDAVVKLIFEAIPQLRERKPGTDGPQLVEREGGKLEVHATAKRHGELKELFDALERIQDLAIDIKADVYELDAAAFAKLQKALPTSKAKPPVLFATTEEPELNGPDAAELKAMEETNKILKAGRVVQTSSGRFINGAEATISARRVVVPYTTDGGPVGVAKENLLFVKEGFRLVALPVVSFDRRFIRFKLTEQSTAITGLKKRELGEIGGKPIVGQSPVVEDLGATGSTVIADDGTAIFRLAYAPKDKVWVVVLKPTIFIQAEEDALKKDGKAIKP